MKPANLTVLLSLILIINAVSALSPRESLVLLGSSLSLEGWIGAVDGWTADSTEPHCEWTGVSCVNEIVVAIDLPSRHLAGTLPPEALRGLPFLKRLDLSHNPIYGVIPPAIAESCSLRTIKLSGTMLSGPIPKAICSMSWLINLDLWGTQVTALPPCMPPAIRTINLAHTRVTEVPEEVIAPELTVVDVTCTAIDCAEEAWDVYMCRDVECKPEEVPDVSWPAFVTHNECGNFILQ